MSKVSQLWHDEVAAIERDFYHSKISRFTARAKLSRLFSPDCRHTIEERLDAVEDQKRESGQFGVGA